MFDGGPHILKEIYQLLKTSEFSRVLVSKLVWALLEEYHWTFTNILKNRSDTFLDEIDQIIKFANVGPVQPNKSAILKLKKDLKALNDINIIERNTDKFEDSLLPSFLGLLFMAEKWDKELALDLKNGLKNKFWDSISQIKLAIKAKHGRRFSMEYILFVDSYILKPRQISSFVRGGIGDGKEIDFESFDRSHKRFLRRKRLGKSVR